MWKCALLLLAVTAFAQEKYPLTMTVNSSDSVPTTSTSSTPTSTNCKSDNLGNTNCDTVGGTRTATSRRTVLSAVGNDGYFYSLECKSGHQFMRTAGLGFGGDVACPIHLGDYKARNDKHGFKFLVTDTNGKHKEVAVAILSMKKPTP